MNALIISIEEFYKYLKRYLFIVKRFHVYVIYFSDSNFLLLIMDAISEEIFCTVDSVKTELITFKTEQKELKQQILKLFQANKKLVDELREMMLLRDHALSEKGILEMKRKLDSANAAKETALAMWQETMQQLEKREELLVGKKSLVECERKETVRSVEHIKEQYQKGLTTLSAELNTYKTDLTSTKQNLLEKTIELDRCKKSLEDTKEKLISSEKLLFQESNQKSEMNEKLNSLQMVLTSTENLLSTKKKELDLVTFKNLELASLLSELKEQNVKLKHDIQVFEKDAKESLFAAQEATLQRKEIALREEQYMKEIEFLKSNTSIDVQKIELKFKSMIKEVEDKSAQKIQSLMDEIQLLHKENGEKQCFFEKAEREKKFLESKLEVVLSETKESLPKDMHLFDDLCHRLTVTERSKDENELRVKSLETELEELRLSKEHEVSTLMKERGVFKERLLVLSKDCNQFFSEKAKLREQLNTLRKKCYDLKKELKLCKVKHTQEITAARVDNEQKQLFLKEQLSSVEEHYKTVCQELQSLLDIQFKINERWKEEVEELISKSESKVVELCDTIARLEFQNTELTNALQLNG